jgi:hypothetical protein
MSERIPIELPKVNVNPENRHSDVIYTHPAFATVVVTNPRGGNDRMFGSATRHNSRITISLHEAELNRHLSNDWIHPGKTICEFSLTEAQWAQFVASSGRGEGTPCTLEYVPQGALDKGHGLQRIPQIGGEPDKAKEFSKEMKQAFLDRMTAIDSQVKSVEALLIKGGANKTELKAIHGTLLSAKESLAGTIKFIGDQFIEHMDNERTKAQIEIEGYISRYAQDLGLKMMAEGHRLEDQPLKITEVEPE